MASVNKRKWTYNDQPREAWVVRYFDENGKQRSKQFEKKKDAETYKRKVERETEDGTHQPDADGVTVKHAAEEFLRAEETRLNDGRISRGHLKNVWMAMDKSILPFLGKRVLHEVKAADVENWYGDLCKVGGLAPVTAKERVIKFGQLCEFGIRRGWLKINPVIEARKQMRGIVADPIATPTHEQVLAILKAAENRRKGQHPRTPKLARCFVHLAAFCGLRFGEISALTLPHVRLDEGVIEVRHSLTQWDELKEPKTRSGVRDVPMPQHVAALLREWIEQEYVPNDKGLLFRVALSRSDKGPGGFIHPASFRNSYWFPLLEAAGIDTKTEPLHFHSLRHFAASWMVSNNMPITDVASLMGHKRFDMTLRVYAHPLVGGERRAAMFNSMADRLLAGPIIEGSLAQGVAGNPA